MMGWLENFDDETTGNPPTDLTADSVNVPDEFEVSEAQSYSGAKSLLIKSQGGATGGGHTDPEIFGTITDTKPFRSMHYIPDGNGWQMYLTQDTDGDLDAAEIAANIVFDDGAGDLVSPWAVAYYAGAYIDTGENWTAATWFEIKIIHDFGADTFDLYYDDGLIKADAAFRTSQNTVKSLQALVESGAHKMYLDDLSVDYSTGWSGNYNGRINPPNINGRAKNEVLKANGVLSA